MKKIIVILFIGVILMLTGCMGEDGKDGDVYLRITFDYGIYN